jgi:DNA repair protein RadA/Sms
MTAVPRLQAPSSSPYVCKACGATHGRWIARCPKCQAWSSSAAPPVASEPQPTRPPPPPSPMPVAVRAPASSPNSPTARSGSLPIPITDVEASVEPRLVTGIEPLDRVLGGGLVVGSLVLFGGEPGIGKSTLLAQLLAAVGCDRILYATGEESIAQVAMRARRVQAAHPRIRIVAETDIDSVLAHAEELQPELLAIDSIHTLVSADVASTAGSVAQVRECTTRLAAFGKSRDLTILVIGHVTKDGALAGPKTLEHLVDVVLQFELGELGAWRELRAHKNRYGSTLEVGSFEMTSSGLHPRDPAAECAPEPPPGALLPLARELLERYLALGGEIDSELGARVEQLRR